MKTRTEISEYKWISAAIHALQMMKNVRDYKLTIEEVIMCFELEIKYCRRVSNDTPATPMITPGPTGLSPANRLSDEEVWLNAFHEVKCERARISQEEYADICLNTFKRRFRKEPK